VDNFSLVKVIALISVFLALLLSFFLLTVNTKSKQANILLASFIALCAIDILGVFLVVYPVIFQFSKTLTFLVFPSFYLYVLSICYCNFRLKTEHLLHAIPTAIYIVAILVVIFNEQNHLLDKLEWFMGSVLLKLQALVYVFAIVVALKRYRRIYLENYTGNSISVYRWINQIVVLFAITLPISIAREFVVYSSFYNVLTWLSILLVVMAFLMFCWIVLKALYQPELFRGVDISMQPSAKFQKQKVTNDSAFNSSINIEVNSQIEQLRRCMEEQEPFVESEITLQDLAILINIPTRDLSVLINQHIGQHFFDFINSYRIKKAMEILRKHSKDEYTIQQVLYDVGFNSKSSFNTAFKKHAGVTPTEYRSKL